MLVCVLINSRPTFDSISDTLTNLFDQTVADNSDILDSLHEQSRAASATPGIINLPAPSFPTAVTEMNF